MERQEQLTTASALVRAAEAAMGPLSLGQVRDLLKDQTDWDASDCDDVAGEIQLTPAEDADEALDRDAPVHCWIVAIYLVDRACGGPEEGGWFYDYGTYAAEFGQHMRGFGRDKAGRDAARAYAEELEATVVKEANEGRREISSVLSEGRYRAMTWENRAPQGWPETVPHYE